MKPQISLSSFSKERTDRRDRRTFTSPEEFQSFLGLQLQSNGFKCLAQTADKTSEACTHPLSRDKASKIFNGINVFVEYGFPSPEAEDSLWRIVLSCICGVHRHHIMVATSSMTPVRVTQYQWLYDKWHGELWAAYREGYDHLASSPVDRDRDTVLPLPPLPPPPPLSSLAEVWKAAATTTAPAERKPPLVRAFTETIGSRKRLGGLWGRFPWRGAMPKRLGGEKDDEAAGKQRGRANTGLSSAVSDTSSWNRDVVVESLLTGTTREHLLNKDASVLERADQSESPPRIKPEDNDEDAVPDTDPRPADGDVFTLDTPTRPPIKRNNAHARSASSPPSGSHLVPSPDSFATKASSVFSNKDALDTPLSPDSYSVPSEQPSCLACGQSQRSQRPPVFNISSHHSVIAKEETSPIQARLRRRPVIVRNIRSGIPRDLVNDVSESEEEGDYKEEENEEEGKDEEDDDEDRARIILYCRNMHHINEPCPFAQNTTQKYPNINIPVLCEPSPNTQYIKHQETQPPTFKPCTSIAPKAVLRDMLSRLHAPILNRKRANPGWLYGFTLADPERKKYIKIGWTEDVPQRMKDTASKCKYEPVLLFQAFLPCAPEVIERMVHLNLRSHQHTMKCDAPSCDATKAGHREWFEIGLDKALDVVLKWVAFSDCMPYAHGLRCLDMYWQKKTSHAWDSMGAKRDPALWVEKYWWPAVERHDRFRA